jgi:hypothetical protein
MNIIITLWSGIAWFFNALLYWLSLFFLVPVENFEILWILIPIWTNLIFSDFYQEKRGTDLGNAISNGAAMLWVGIDWTRFLWRRISEENLTVSFSLFFEFFLCALILGLGLVIIIQGVKGHNIATKIGRVRVTSYVMLVLSPLIYGIETLSFKYLFSIVFFFPLFYLLFEMIDRSLPDPKSIKRAHFGAPSYQRIPPLQYTNFNQNYPTSEYPRMPNQNVMQQPNQRL